MKKVCDLWYIHCMNNGKINNVTTVMQFMSVKPHVHLQIEYVDTEVLHTKFQKIWLTSKTWKEVQR